MLNKRKRKANHATQPTGRFRYQLSQEQKKKVNAKNEELEKTENIITITDDAINIAEEVKDALRSGTVKGVTLTLIASFLDLMSIKIQSSNLAKRKKDAIIKVLDGLSLLTECIQAVFDDTTRFLLVWKQGMLSTQEDKYKKKHIELLASLAGAFIVIININPFNGIFNSTLFILEGFIVIAYVILIIANHGESIIFTFRKNAIFLCYSLIDYIAVSTYLVLNDIEKDITSILKNGKHKSPQKKHKKSKKKKKGKKKIK